MATTFPYLGSSYKSSSYENPTFRYLTTLIPRRLKALFHLCEQVFMSPTAGAGIRKIAEYPITDPELTTQNQSERKTVQDLLKNVFKMKRKQTISMYNLFVYGNDFSSFQESFVAEVTCKHCKAIHSLEFLQDFKYFYKSVSILYDCPEDNCGKTSNSKISNRLVEDINACSLNHWNPKRIEIDHNPLSGHSIYYYKPSPEIVTRVENGDRHLVETLPVDFLEAIGSGERFMFEEDQIFHMKLDGPTGLENESGWGVPILLAAIETYLYISVMRKANESIAMEHIESFRALSPAMVAPSGDPTHAASMKKYVKEVASAYDRWRSGDRNGVFFTAIPLTQTTVGGDARQMMTAQEIEAAENNILATIGIPREFVYGGMSYGPGSGAVLRQLENQLVAHISQCSDLLQWVVNKVCDFLKIGEIQAEMGSFTIQDDAYLKQAALQLYQAGELSASTLMTVYSFDREEERRKIKTEQVDQVREQADIEKETEEVQNDIVAQAEAAAQTDTAGPNYNPNDLIAMADQHVEEMMNDPAGPRSFLANLENTDGAMYAIVKWRYEQMQQQQNTQMMAEANQQQ